MFVLKSWLSLLDHETELMVVLIAGDGMVAYRDVCLLSPFGREGGLTFQCLRAMRYWGLNQGQTCAPPLSSVISFFG